MYGNSDGKVQVFTSCVRIRIQKAKAVQHLRYVQLVNLLRWERWWERIAIVMARKVSNNGINANALSLKNFVLVFCQVIGRKTLASSLSSQLT